MAPDATQSNSRSEPASATVPAKHTTAPSPDPEPQSSLPAQNTQQDADAKSDISSNSLFDDEDADGEPDDHDLTRNAHQPAARPAQPTLSIPTSAPQPVQRSLIPPKNAPPLLDPPAYATFSSDILMTASIDGQVILWDKRVSSSGGVNGRGGGGVGRLWMSDKTPPWCLSVRPCLFWFLPVLKF
jgi:transcriptional activator SPT8